MLKIMSLGNSNLKQQRKSTTHQSTKNTTCCYYVEQQKLSFSTVENAKWFNHFERQFLQILTKLKDGNNNPVYKTAKDTLMYRSVLCTLWERERVG